MPEEPDWSVTTFEGNRRRQHQQFHALSFREKLARIEEMNEVAERLSQRRPDVQAGPRSEGDTRIDRKPAG